MYCADNMYKIVHVLGNMFLMNKKKVVFGLLKFMVIILQGCTEYRIFLYWTSLQSKSTLRRIQLSIIGPL
jgi:hypothetical protein